MKKMVKIAGLFVAIAMILSLFLVACAAPTPVAPSSAAPTVSAEKPAVEPSKEAPPAAEGKKKVALITPDPANAFFATEEIIAKPLLESMGYEVLAMVHLEDAAKLSEHFDTAIAAKVAAIICDGTGGDTDIATVQKAVDANIPVFLIDREINKSGLAISQIVANNLQGAEAVAEYWVEQMGEKGGYIELLGKETDTNAGVRSKGFHNKIDPFPELKLLDAQTANWQQTEAQTVMDTLIQKHGDKIKGVICGNDTMCMGAIAALQNAKMTGVIVAGFDGNNDVRDAIKAGTAVATGLQQLAYITELACQQADTFIKTGKTGVADERQIIDCLLINKDNADKLNNFVMAK